MESAILAKIVIKFAQLVKFCLETAHNVEGIVCLQTVYAQRKLLKMEYLMNALLVLINVGIVPLVNTIV